MKNPIAAAHDGLWPTQAYNAAGEVATLCAMVRHTVEIAAGLTGAGRRVDLTGLDHTIGLLCAKALDLAAADGRAARNELVLLLTKIDALSLALQAECS